MGKFDFTSCSAARAGTICVLTALTLPGCGHKLATNPRDQALAYYKALNKQDWKAVYSLTAFDAAEKKVFTSPERFDRYMKQVVGKDPSAQEGYDRISRLTAIGVGEAKTRGERAQVATTARLSYFGVPTTFHGTAQMIREDGIWKFDTSEPDQNLIARRIIELLGKPDLNDIRKRARAGTAKIDSSEWPGPAAYLIWLKRFGVKLLVKPVR